MKCGIRVGLALVMLGVMTAFTFGSAASAAELGGVKLDESVRVANQDLKLNGAGVRYKVIFKVYAAGLYLPEKSNNLQEILASPGPKRVTLVMLRNVDSDSFGQAFMDGIKKNSGITERAKFINQMINFGQMFASTPEIKKGDVITLDWIPGSGTFCQLNGKKISEFIPDVAFYNALIKIWLGSNPVDYKLKTAMLGGNS